MTKPLVVRLTLENSSEQRRVVSLEPYGDYCELEPHATVHATWELEPDGEVHLEIAVTDDALIVCDASNPLCELRPGRDQPGGEFWESASPAS